MPSFIVYNSVGEITKIVVAPTALIELQKDTDENHIEGEADSLLHYIEAGEVKTFPTKPTTYHTWSWETKTYIITPEQLQLAKDETKTALDLKRHNLALQPIVYDSKALDADTQAQANLNGKLQEIFAREAASTPLVSGQMFWKDADNITHSWADQTAYKLWLQGLVIAISSRNTVLYATAWGKKAEVEALTDINDIIAYDVNAGW